MSGRRLALAAGVVAVALASAASTAVAGVERFAVLIGNDAGEADEQRLRFAETDAAKVREVLVDLGGFRPENVVLVQGGTAAGARRALITTNDRIRTLSAGTDAMLVVYYSGHADAEALHLGDSRFELDELERLVRGSSAEVRLLVVDACRSGSITRVKGGRRTAGFEIRVDEALASEGAVFLTSSAADEDAQESDELGGSFFTHYLVSGLLGAADASGDGQVSLAEAYRYAYDNTLRASSRTLAGMQHPTFRYQLAGRGDIVLTSPGGKGRGWLRFPSGRTYLVMRGDLDGGVVGEVGARDGRRRLSLRPGAYFVRGRGRDHLLEGTVWLDAGAEVDVADRKLRRIEYARLVRKGGGVLERVHGPEAGLVAHGALANASRPCQGVFAGYRLEYPSLDIGARASWCRASYANDDLAATIDELDLALRVAKLWDVGPVAVGPTLTVGGGLLHQRFETRGVAPARSSAQGHVGAGLTAGIDLVGALHATADLGVETYLFRLREGDADVLEPTAALRFALGLGWRL